MRRQRDERTERLWQKVFRHVSPLVLLIWLGFYVAVMAVFLTTRESIPWSLNQRVDRDITARVDFVIEDPVRTDQDRESARASAPNVYAPNPTPREQLAVQLTELVQVVASTEDEEALKEALAAQQWPTSEAFIEMLRGFLTEEGAKAYDELVSAVTRRLGAEYLVEDSPEATRTPPTSILRRPSDSELEIPTSQLRFLRDRAQVLELARGIVGQVRNCPEPLREPLAERIVSVLMGPPETMPPQLNPPWRFDQEATGRVVAEAIARVPGRVTPVRTGDVLVKAGTSLGEADLARLRLEHEAYLEAQKVDPLMARQARLRQLGMAVVVLLITAGLISYVCSYQERIFRKPARTVGLAALLLLMLILNRLLQGILEPYTTPPELSVGLVVIAAALLTIAYSQRFAFGVSGVLAVLLTLSSQASLGVLLTLLAAMTVTVFGLREVRSRSRIVVIGTLAAAAAFITSAAMGLTTRQDLDYILKHAAYAALSAFLAGVIVQATLQLFERLFGIATSMTLLEWCDASRPLLRRLAQETPGTYSHSLVLSQLAEEAAEAIGANGLLARVGALYHDIGKIPKAEYFVENQEPRMNRHDRLSPTMSLLIIVGHVKDGMEMARAYGLPRVLHQFIAEHHGTTVVRYFHHAANEAVRSSGRHEREIPESEFRYPGPKPRSKESAILMLCDGCEGAVRALTEPTPTRIESTVHNVVKGRLMDGQFDECDITLRELYLVEQSLVKSLCAIHHGRIKYPKGEAARAATAAEGESPRAAVRSSTGPAPEPVAAGKQA